MHAKPNGKLEEAATLDDLYPTATYHGQEFWLVWSGSSWRSNHSGAPVRPEIDTSKTGARTAYPGGKGPLLRNRTARSQLLRQQAEEALGWAVGVGDRDGL
jgi:hypothetical protein